MNSMSSPYYLSRVMQHAHGKARAVAESDSIVLLLGESGSGKDHLARYIHDYSKRSLNPFFSLNCAAIPPGLAESELFGHERGAFTGACGTKIGLIELAKDGTLVLNEIGDIPLSLQAKLLTFLDTLEFVRVGGRKKVKVNVRIIGATNRELGRMVSQGTFRQDLFYRLSVFPIVVPPLRDRKEDIPILAKQLLAVLAGKMGLDFLPPLEPAAMERLVAYEWPGNVRELKNVLERALILSHGTNIGTASITFDGCSHGDPVALLPGDPPERGISGSPPDHLYLRDSQCLAPHGCRIQLTDEQFERMMRELFGEKPTPTGAVAVALGCSRKTVSMRINRLELVRGESGRMRTGTKKQIIDEVQQWIRDNPVG